MKPLRRKLAVGGALVVALLVTAVVIIHLPGVQRNVWNRLSDSIEQTSGWRLAAEEVGFRAFPARLRLHQVTAAAEGRTVVAIDTLEARWGWLGLARAPRRLDLLVVDGVIVHPAAMPERSGTTEDSAASVWELVEIGELRVLGVGGTGSISGVEIVVGGVNLDGRLVAGEGAAHISARSLELARDERVLDLGTAGLDVQVSEHRLGLEVLELASPVLRVSVIGETDLSPTTSGRFEVTAAADIAEIAHWWDPNIETGLDPKGRLELEGRVELTEAEGLRLEIAHRGQPIRVAGYDLEELELVLEDGTPTVRAAHPDWGRMRVTMTAPTVADLEAKLTQAPIDRALASLAPDVASFVGQPATLSGEIAGTVSYPIVPETVSGRADLLMESPAGRFAIRADGAGRAWHVAELDARAFGVLLRGSGRLEAGGAVSGDLRLSAAAPGQVFESVARWLPGVGDLDVGGGPIEARARIDGDMAAPKLSASAVWERPVIGDRAFELFEAEASGDFDELEWQLDLTAGHAASLHGSGWARPLDSEVGGSWSMRSDDLVGLATMLALPSDLVVDGQFEARGRFTASPGGARLEGDVSAPRVAVDAWSVDNLRSGFAATPGAVTLSDLTAQVLSGTLDGELALAMGEAGDSLSADLRWSGVDLDELPIDVPDAAIGLVSGRVRLEGSLTRPEGDLEMRWTPSQAEPLVGDVQVVATLTGGELEVVSERIATVAGPVSIAIVAPLGDVSRPQWLWPEAPRGPVRATADVLGFKTGPLVERFEVDGVPVEVEADLRAELLWNPLAPRAPHVALEASNLRLRHETGDLVAEGPLVVTLDDDGLELAPVVLVGLGSRVEASAVYIPETHAIDGRLHARLAPEVADLLPIPLSIEGPIAIDADFEVPAERSLSLMAVQGELTVDHDGGRMVMRDPPVEIRDLRVEASLEDGVVSISDGSAEVNRGRVELGGGWDPASGQGVVLELDDVTTVVAGILTKWDGDLVVEPDDDRLARVAGDLTLVVGLWDERVDLASMMLADESLDTASEELLYDIGLDLTVRGLAGIRVENNLGRFDVNWDEMRVGGSAAMPVLRGEVRIAPGGVLVLAGHEVEVRRGLLEFTGNPDIDPLVEIVPATDTTLFGDAEGVATTELVTRTLAQGISSALGFENETLRPAEIAVQTERDPSVRFMVGQRLSPQLALFLATNLTDVQDRMTMLQYWNVPGLRGLALQAYQETADDNAGANIFQRFEWGGSKILTDRPQIHRIRLEGEWPLSKRKLRRATQLRRGHPFDDFLLFVAAVRLERMLAEEGYQNARVTAVQEGPQSSPILVFTCDPGVSQPVDFEGDSLPSRVRREVTALYTRQPREDASLEAMRSLVRQHVVANGFMKPQVAVERRGDVVLVDVRKGERTQLEGPFFEGMPVDAVAPAVRALGTPEALAYAVDQPDWASRVVERTLKSAGYLEGRVVAVSTAPAERGRFGVHVTVEPGERAVVGSVEIRGDDPLGMTATADFTVRPGMPLDRPAIDSAVRDIRHAYVERGYREATVRSSIESAPDGSWRVAVSVDPGRQRTVREVRFSGQRDISKKVLLKGVTLEPGGVLTNRELDRSASQIANFAPVERDSVEVRPVGSSQADIEFGIFEKKRWTLEVGGGWSTERSFGAAFGARDDNLFGRGIGLNLRGSLDEVEKKIFLLGSVPPVPGGRLSFITTIGYSTGDAPDEPDILNQDQKLASLEASYRLPKNVQIGVYYRWTDTRTYEKVPDEYYPLDTSLQVGLLGARAVVDRFDYLFDPRRGWGLTSDIGWSGGAIGSELEYVSWLTGFGLALEPFAGATWMQAVRIGAAEPLKGTSLDSEARFFAGGQASVRGFDLNTVGPLTYGYRGDLVLVPAGGGALFILNEELRIPVWDPLRLAVFADIGQVWESWREADLDFAVGVGLGVRWSTPIGPLWADVAWPVANVGISSRKPKFYLGIGRPF